MDNETLPPSAAAVVKSPRATSSFAPSGTIVAAQALANTDRDRNGVFANLVKEDSDISGLVAYSIYKQNKLDWLQAFESAKGRARTNPNSPPTSSGKAPPSRLATYRHLAESTLAGKGPDVDRGLSRHPSNMAAGQANTLLSPRLLVTYAIIALLFVVAFWLAAHYTVSNH